MNLIKQALVKSLSQRVLVGPGKRFVFVYHDISDEGSFQYSDLYSTRVSVFRQQIEFLSRHFTLVSLEDLLAPDSDGPKQRLAAITFDDGFLSVRETAHPYLSAKGIPFTVFASRLAVTENRLFNGSEDAKLEGAAGQKVFLDEEDVKFLSRGGVRIGSHAATHRVLAECDDEALREEVEGNKLYLEGLTEKPVRHLALPFGKREHYDERVLEFCRRAGHDFVYSSNPTFFDLSSDAYRRRLIPRIGLTNQTPAEMLFIINRPLLKTVDI